VIAVKDTELAAEAEVARVRVLCEIQPDAHRPKLAVALVQLSQELSRLKRHAEAASAADEAIDVYEQLGGATGAYADGLALATFTLGRSLHRGGQTDDGFTLIEEGIQIRRRLHRNHPEYKARFVGAMLLDYVEALIASGRFGKALSVANEAVAMYRERRAEVPGSYTRELATALIDTARAQRGAGELGPALDTVRRAVNLLRGLNETDPRRGDELSRAQRVMAAILTDLDRPDEAAAAIADAKHPH
jgi:tetratricopeptide (TPR) repeat protein